MSVLAAFAVPHPPIILPEVGKGEEIRIQKTSEAYSETARRIARLRPDTVVITSPHATAYSDYIHISPGVSAKGDMGSFRAKSVRVEAAYDTEFAKLTAFLAEEAGIPAGTMGEREPKLDHGTIIPLYFLNQEYRDYRLVRIGLSGLPPAEHYRLGKCIAKAADRLSRRTVVIASGDLSHKLEKDGPYGFAKEGPAFDALVTEAFAKGDFLSLLTIPEELSEAAAECGLRSFQIMAGALDKKAVQSELLSYEGPFGVGYGVAAFEVTGEDDSRAFDALAENRERKALESQKAGEDAYVRLARHSLEHFVKTGKQAALPEDVPAELLERRAGAFVSLKEHGRLRGCIGTIEPTAKNLAYEIMRNAVAACSEDPRFDPVQEEELERLVYSVDVLGAPEEIGDKDLLDPARYGVIVQSGGRRGLLLPDLAGVDTVEKQIAIARQKAGIGADEKVRLFRFEVMRHK